MQFFKVKSTGFTILWKRYVDTVLSRKSGHLGSEEENYLKMARLEISLMENMYQIYSLSRRVAKVVLPPALKGND